MTTRLSGLMWKRWVALLAASALVLAACGGDDDDGGAGATTTRSEATTTTAGEGTTTVPATEVAARVYFLDADVHLVAAGRTVTAPAVATAALEALLAGPQGIETELGYSSAIPSGTRLLGVDIDGDVATVDLSGEFVSGGGSASMLGRLAQAVYTVTQFDGVERVKFMVDGVPTDTIGGEGVMIDADGAARDDFTDQLPAILVEQPTPGATVASPVQVTGISNTFEATIQYAVTDPEGLILEDGFVTAGGTNGEWLPFDFSVEFATERTGLGAVSVWTVSAEDGSRQDIVEIPVQMG